MTRMSEHHHRQQQAQDRLEDQRRAEEDARNTCRFFQYNNRRRRAGLAPFSWADYVDRKQRKRQYKQASQLLEKANKLIDRAYEAHCKTTHKKDLQSAVDRSRLLTGGQS